jgi:hypothetical protein
MSIEKIERFAFETVIHVCEPARHGEPDHFRRVVLRHDDRQRAELKTIDNEELTRLRTEHLFAVDMAEVDVVGTVVFVKQSGR